MTEKVLIVSDTEDEVARDVAVALSRSGVECAWFASDRLADQAVSWQLMDRGLCSSWCDPAVTTVWYRNRPKITVVPKPTRWQRFTQHLSLRRMIREEVDRQFLSQERRLLQRGVCEYYRNCRWVNRPEADWQAGPKMVQLQAMRQVGLSVPPTLVTGNEENLRRFYLDMNGHVIVKPHGIQYVDLHNHTFPFKTRFLKRERDIPSAVQGGVVLAQKRLDIDYEVRVIVMNEKIFAFKREYDGVVEDIKSLGRNVRDSQYELDRVTASRLIQLCRSLNLVYGAVDLVRTNTGELIGLEVNPSGQCFWLEETGIDLETPFVQMLLGE